MALNSQMESSEYENERQIYIQMGYSSETITKVDRMMDFITMEEPEVVSIKLYQMTAFCSENPPNRKLLVLKGVQKKLEYIIQKHSSCTLTWALLLQIELYKDEEILTEMVKKASLLFISRIVKLYVQFNVATFQSYCLYILSALVTNDRIRRYMYCYGVTSSVFSVLRSTGDIDLQTTSLCFLRLLLEAPDVDLLISSAKEMSLQCLLCYLEDMNIQIQQLTMIILIKLSYLENERVQKAMVEENVVISMFSIIMTSSKTNLHQGAMTFITNMMKWKHVCHYVAHRQELTRFLEFMDICSDEFAIFTATVVNRLSEYEELLQVLYEAYVEDGLISLLRFSDAFINYHICCAANNLSKHEQLCDKVLNEDFMESVIDLALVPIYPTYFRSIALQTISNFLKRSSRTLNMVYKLDKESKLQSMFIEDKLNDDCVESLLRIFESCCISFTLKKRMNNEMFCRSLLKQFVRPNATLSDLSYEIIKWLVYMEEFLQFFVDWNGPKALVNKLRCMTDEEKIKDLVLFINELVEDDQVAKDFLNEKLHICLEEIRPKFHDPRVIKRIIERLGKMYLPYKFHVDGRVEIEQALDTGFYVVHGKYDGGFPFLDTLAQENVSNEYTAYVVDYSLGTDTERIVDPRLLRKSKAAKKQKRKIQVRKSDRLPVSAKPSLPSIPESDEQSVLTSRTIKPLSNLIYRAISQDPYLPKLVENAGRRMFRMRRCFTIHEQIRVLSRFIERHTTDSVTGRTIEEEFELYRNHIKGLKVEHKTNVIPIGCVRYGNCVERAVLFKAVADKVGILASLVRGSNGFMWNEIPLNVSAKEYLSYDKAHLTFGVVDLMWDVGRIMIAGGKEADNYCGTRTSIRFKPKKTPLTKNE